MKGQCTSAECGIDADVAGLADDIRSNSCMAQSRLQGGLITDDQHMWQRATQRGQGIQRHRPGEAAPQRIGYDESRLCMLDWFESDQPGNGGGGHHPESVSTFM